MTRPPILAYEVTRNFERLLCEYTGAPFAVALNSCTAALLLVITWCLRKEWSVEHGSWLTVDGLNPKIEIPKRTYVSVPMSIIHACGRPTFRDEEWTGCYQLRPLPIYDCARRFTSGMYVAGQFQCVSFAASKILAAEQGGAILHDDPKADAWFRRMRFDGRTEGLDPSEDAIKEVGHHCIMTPSVAAGLLVRLHHLPRTNPDMGPHEYPDLSLMPVFR